MMEPESKKCKLDLFVALESSKTEINPILSEDVFGSVKKTQVIVLKVKDKKLTSDAVKEVSTKFPVLHLQHLKRVKKAEIKNETCLFIYLDSIEKFKIKLSKVDNEDNLNELSEIDKHYILKKLLDISFNISLFENAVYTSNVAAHQPKIRSVFKEAVVLWPCSYHEDAYLTKLVSKNFFSSDELELIVKNMNEILSISNSITDVKDNGVIMMVHSKDDTRKIVNKSFRRKHPLQHCTLVAIDLVAHSQGGGAWNYSYIHDDDNTKSNIKQTYEDLDEYCKDNEYICTDCDVFLSHEPCMMCAMALLHSRVRRIFFHHFSQTKGAVSSVCKLHLSSGINHRYEVFQVSRKE